MQNITKIMRVVLAVVLMVSLAALSGCAGALKNATTPAASADNPQDVQTAEQRDATINERKVRAYFAKAKEDSVQLAALIQDMPKGADLQSHSYLGNTKKTVITNLDDSDTLTKMIGAALYDKISYLEIVALPNAKQVASIEKIIEKSTGGTPSLAIRYIAPVNRELEIDAFKAELERAVVAQHTAGLNVVGCLLLGASSDSAVDKYLAQLKVVDEVYRDHATQEGKTPPNIVYTLDKFESLYSIAGSAPTTLDVQVNLSHALRIESTDGLERENDLYEGLNALKAAKHGAVVRFDALNILNLHQRQGIIDLGASKPYKLLKAVGVPVAIALERPTTYLGNHTSLYAAATIAYDLTYDDYKALVYASYDLSALPDEGKIWSKGELDKQFAAYELWAAGQFDQLGL